MTRDVLMSFDISTFTFITNRWPPEISFYQNLPVNNVLRTNHFYSVDIWNCAYSHAQFCPTLCDPMDCSLPGSPVHGTSQARILEWVAILFSRAPSQPRDRTWVSCLAGGFFTVLATREGRVYVCVCVCVYKEVRFVWRKSRVIGLEMGITEMSNFF